MARRKREPMSDGSFEPKVVKKRQKDISGIGQKIIALYAKGMTTRQISETIEDIYGFEVSNGTTFERDGFKDSIIFPPLLVRSVLRRA